MSNRPGICWECIKREDCKAFNKNPDANVTECGRFKRKEQNENNNRMDKKVYFPH